MKKIVDISHSECILGEIHVDLPDGFQHFLLAHRARVVRVDALKCPLVLLELLIVNQVDKHH